MPRLSLQILPRLRRGRVLHVGQNSMQIYGLSGSVLDAIQHNINAVTVVACLPAPTDSKASPASFERGIAGLADAVQQASTRTAGMVGYIGEWHSHPPGHSASPSRDDIEQLVHLTLGMAEDGLPAIQLIVGEQDLHLLQGEVR